MPELPEVEVVRAGLAPAVTGPSSSGVTVLDERALTRHSGNRCDFEPASPAAVVEAATRGKFLWLPLATDDGAPAEEALVAHLGMSGQLLLREPGAATRHERVRLDIHHPAHAELRRRVRRPAHLRLDSRSIT